MNFREIPAQGYTLKLRPADEEIPVFNKAEVVFISESEHFVNMWDLLVVITGIEKPVLLRAETLDDKNAEQFRLDYSTGLTFAAELEPTGDGELLLSIVFFRRQKVFIEKIDIAIDDVIKEKIIKKLQSKKHKTVTEDKFFDWLKEEFTYRQFSGKDLFFAYTYAQTEAEHEQQVRLASSSKQETEEVQTPEKANLETAFMLVGRNYEASIVKKSIGQGREVFALSKFRSRRKGNAAYVKPAEGEIGFQDHTRAEVCHANALLLSEAMASKVDYLSTWKRFGELEGDISLAKARLFGVIHYADPRQNRDVVDSTTVKIVDVLLPDADHLLRTAGDTISLRLVQQEPQYLHDNKITFAQYRETMKKASAPEAGVEDFQILSYDSFHRELTLKTQRKLPAKGCLVLSLFGEAIQTVRRDSAWHKIINSECPNPNMGLILEDGVEVKSIPSVQKRKLSSYVQHKVFAHPPTSAQENAIYVALNTPDIALIQGPPGTGKTTVVAAIVERLNELSSSSGPHRILLTGFQHVAVENMISRISLNGIPVPKVGLARGQAEEEANTLKEELDKWISKLVDQLKGRYVKNELPALSEIQKVGISYLLDPNEEAGRQLVHLIFTYAQTKRDTALVKSAQLILDEMLGQKQLTEQNDHLKYVRRLRVTELGFLDDGADRAAELLAEIPGLLTSEEKTLLNKASFWTSNKGVPPWLNELVALKQRLLLTLTQPPIFSYARSKDAIAKLFEKFLKRSEAYQDSMSIEAKKAEAVASFLAQIDDNPKVLSDALATYSFAIGATCQQSVNKRLMADIGNDLGSDFAYDYVIVDEAARVSPRDLLIVFSQGRRVILVGDHRQLPHIVDEMAAEMFERDMTSARQEEWLKRSLFEYLFTERLLQIEVGDGVRRRVTLDTQFRMHPVLGDFISRNFYERFNPSEKILSGLPARYFAHELPGVENLPAVWIDVPNSLGETQRIRTSYTRRAECKAIKQILQKWMHSEAGKTLTFGVIAFYSKQVEMLQEELNNCGLPPRLEIGSVDAFQGKEYDVVLLSVVRSDRTPAPWNPESDDENESQGRRHYGHLCLYNRLNVAMSRQKRLLAVVGDSALVKTELARSQIPGLADFYRTVCQEGVVLNSLGQRQNADVSCELARKTEA